jgi:hypothetical protein
MFDPLAVVLADKAVVHHVMSGRPDAPTTPERPPRRRLRRGAGTALRWLADRVEPRRDLCAGGVTRSRVAPAAGQVRMVA